MSKIKIRGERSVETKLMRLACELRDDARRVRRDHHENAPVAYTTLTRFMDEAAQLLSNAVDVLMRDVTQNHVVNRQIGNYVIYSATLNTPPFYVRMAGDVAQLSGPHSDMTDAVYAVQRFQATDKRRKG